MNYVKWILFAAAAAAVFALGRCTVAEREVEPADAAAAPAADAGEPVIWTCPMHPEVKLPENVPCPKCGMDLVRLTGDDPGPRRLALTASAVALARIATAPVERRWLTMPVRLVGKVEFDQTRVRTIAARVPGRLDRLYVDYEGIQVRPGDHLVSLYSPELLAAQQELIEAKKRFEDTSGDPDAFLAQSNRRGYESAREKLVLWGLSADQVDAIEARGTAEDHLMIRSPARGVVIDKERDEGDYVQVGTPIYRIAELDHLWIVLDAYEQDLPWVRYGQDVTVTAEALPGEVFDGRVAFLAPVLDDRTRTVQVRVNVANPDGRLKPGMFVSAVVRARVGRDGAVMPPGLAGKWISPMHPEIVKDGPGQCDVCGMDLVPAESLGYADSGDAERPLVVPASAVLVTGTRAVAYVLVPGTEKPTYEGREVVLGPRAGDRYVVRSGLRDNERVVVHGAFRVDSAMQIQAKPSMMSQRGDADTFTGPDTIVFRTSLRGLYAAYFAMQQALAHDDVDGARRAADLIVQSLDDVDGGGLPAPARPRWQEERDVIAREARAAADAPGIARVRLRFEPLSNSFLALERTFRHAGDTAHYEAHCPMARDNVGASWLSATSAIENPYFGAEMFACGEIRAQYPGVPVVHRPATGEVDPTITPQDTEPPQPDAQPGAPAPRSAVDDVYDPYFDLQRALAADDLTAAAAAWRTLAAAAAAPTAPSPGVADALERLGATLAPLPGDDIEAVRARFAQVTTDVLALHDAAGHGGDRTFYRVHCPMAFDNKGADWLQTDATVDNPYFGARMRRCGSVTAELAPRTEHR